MSCVEITPAMRRLFDSLRVWPLDRELLVELRASPEWAQARAWGWLMENGDLTGSGLAHADVLPSGILSD